MDFKKSMAIFVAALMLIGCIIPLTSSGNDAADQYFIDGGDHKDTVPTGYTAIETVDDLRNIADDLTADYILMNDIVFTEDDYLPNGVILSVGVTTSSPDITVTVKYKLSASDNWISNGVSVDVWFKGEKYTTSKGTVTITGKYTNGDPYFISVIGTLDGKEVAASVYSPNATAASIEINSTGNFEMIPGAFSGTLDGNGYIIKGMNVVGVDAYAAMFTEISGTVKNLGLVGANIASVCPTSVPEAAGFALGLNASATIENCFVSGNILSSSILRNSAVNSHAGGIVVTNLGKITKSYTTGAVASMTCEGNPGVGGIASYAYGDIEDCYNSGNILSESYSGAGTAMAGGIMGYFADNAVGIISSSHNTGAVKASSNGVSYAGGVIGYGKPVNAIHSNYNNGAITSVTTDTANTCVAYAGGIAGYAPTIYKSYNTGAVTAKAPSGDTASAGGIAGGANLIYNCYSSVSYSSISTTPSASSTSTRAYKGGIAGIMDTGGAIVSCYYLAPSSGDSKLYGAGLTITVDGELPDDKVIVTIDFDSSMGSVKCTYKITEVPDGSSTPVQNTYTVDYAGPIIVDKGSEVELEATPKDNYRFSAWDGLGTNASNVKFNADTFVDVTAVFLKYKNDSDSILVSEITITGDDTKGTVEYTVSEKVTNEEGEQEDYIYTGTYAYGESLIVKKGVNVTLKGIPYEGCTVTGWTGDVTSSDDAVTITTSADTYALTVTFSGDPTGGSGNTPGPTPGDTPTASTNNRSSIQKSGPKTADQLKDYNTYYNEETWIWNPSVRIPGWLDVSMDGPQWTKTGAAGGTSDPSINNNYPYLVEIIPGQVHILSNPSHVHVKSGVAVEFSITAVSDVKMTFQWQSGSSAGDSGWSNISGETKDTYSLTSSASAEKYYRCRISVSVGGSTYYTYSNAAKLTIAPVEIKTIDDLKKIGTDMSGSYIQKADLYFVKNGTSYDRNDGTDVTLTPSIDGTDLVLKFTYVNSQEATVGVPSLNVWIEGVSDGTTNSGSFTIPKPTDGQYTVVIYGTIEGKSVAIPYDLTVSDKPSVAVGTKSWNGLFDPIGTEDRPFTGIYDGNGYKIYGLEIGAYAGSGTVSAGLFGYNEGTVKNVAIEGGHVLAASNGSNTAVAGGIAAVSTGSIESSYNTATVIAISAQEAVAGGLVGTAGTLDTNAVSKSYNTGAVTAWVPSGGTASAGGIAGSIENAGSPGFISNCYNTGAVSATTNAGGIIGLDSSGSEIANCYSTGYVSATKAGGIMGSTTGGSIVNCYFLEGSGSTNMTLVGDGTYTTDGASSPDRTSDQESGAKSASKMKSESTYYTGTTTTSDGDVAGWDFSSGKVWTMSSGSYPGLKSVTPSGGGGNGGDGDNNTMMIIGIVAAILVVILAGYVLLKRRKA